MPDLARSHRHISAQGGNVAGESVEEWEEREVNNLTTRNASAFETAVTMRHLDQVLLMIGLGKIHIRLA